MKLNRIRTITALVIAISLIGGAGLAMPASAADTRYITISATGTTTVVPDAVRINATVSVLGTTSKSALATSATTSSAVRAALTVNKVATKDVATQSVTVYPEYSYPQDGGKPVLTGYRASQSFDITIRSASTAGAVVDAIVEAGGDNVQINGVSPFVLDNNKATEKARAYAVGRAKAKAASYAKLLGIKLGRVIYLDETSTPSSFPIYTSAAKADSAATVVDLGEQKVSVSVTVRWAIN
ncbi:MAG: DUF541 domain-containing protein [Actinobacteria bacterium]|uniref:Unannotated protein n=1 Tax=freshwater metagenome TaxID=449393 RepID=A0A6J6Z4U9_9ZZZZ|nr:DUF541 domain-containing protein [Actinomycetota bacterium]MSX71496.1 DUF541 domain-containing protein [Actinomycetota bacterium]MSY69250.1 DUF541 domain-containing protein [Actinomycetota bacterium]MTA75427.1 DUF541 domain-containing protein [Actinomycetota bacterium]